MEIAVTTQFNLEVMSQCNSAVPFDPNFIIIQTTDEPIPCFNSSAASSWQLKLDDDLANLDYGNI